MTTTSTNLLPPAIVQELDKHIVGQQDAKKAVALALRNRYRRMHVEPELRNEITPKNILMIGPTGVGKTEIARRLAKLARAPFLKIEATKFTEVGYVGRDVDSIVRDLVDVAVKLAREEAHASVKQQAEDAAYDKIIDALLPHSKDKDDADSLSSRAVYRKKLETDELDEQEVELELSQQAVGIEIMAPPGMEEMTSQLQSMFQNISNDKTKLRSLKVKVAKKTLAEQEAAKLVNEEELKAKAIDAVEQNGIVFIDEMDKITHRSDRQGADVSREGVQRDLLPLIEGCTVTTRYGTVKTDHILFIASGAFHLSKPSDLIPELQGRLPIRVELNALLPEDFVRILTEPDASLTTQYTALLKTEDLDLEFSADAIDKIANLAWQINEKTENIGARRLHTVMEKLLEDISYRADELKASKQVIDAAYVEQQIGALCASEDLSHFIL